MGEQYWNQLEVLPTGILALPQHLANSLVLCSALLKAQTKRGYSIGSAAIFIKFDRFPPGHAWEQSQNMMELMLVSNGAILSIICNFGECVLQSKPYFLRWYAEIKSLECKSSCIFGNYKTKIKSVIQFRNNKGQIQLKNAVSNFNLDDDKTFIHKAETCTFFISENWKLLHTCYRL